MADTEDPVRKDPDAPQGEASAGAPSETREEVRSEAQTGEFDKDVNISGIVWTAAVLTGITALSFVLMWWFFQGLMSYKEAQDPQPLPIREAAGPIEPPGPKLQSTPEEDLQRMREQEEALLSGYSLIEGAEGYARIPVDEALDLALELEVVGGAAAGDPAPERGEGMSSGDEAVERPETATPADAADSEDAGASRAVAATDKESMTHR